ncbi:MAG: protein kinase domain-containing protein [Rhodoferax sp.]
MVESLLSGNGRSSPNGASLRPSGTLGRFELRRVLGQGAQSTVWLAFDPRMEREVAIKVMRPGEGSDDTAVAQWLQEARSVASVSHPNIVPVYEADIQDRQPYLVFEFVAGQTLDQWLKQRGALPVNEAVALMMEVLDALAVAHAAGVVHRDLKPSNIVVDAAGRARVMDFGIAARIQGAASKDAQFAAGGTVGYLAPEAADGAAPSPSMDIFSAGLVLAEMLMGHALIDARDPHRAVYRVLHEPLLLPEQLDAAVDDGLRAIAARALAREPGQRFASARAFQTELQQWLKPRASANAAVGGGSSTLDFLLRRMRHKSDFPALSESVVRIQSMATSETESVNSVTNEILKDVALTNKLLRLVNSAHYARGGSISTVSRAVHLVGFNGIRNMALSMVLLEHMQDKAHAAQLKEEFLRSMMAGSIASEMCPVLRDSEEAFIGSMFQNLGRLLVQYYFPEEAIQIRALVQSQREPVAEAAAALSVLGLGFEELGLGIAKAWGLPPSMQRCMRKPSGTPPASAATDSAERLRWIALAANEMADALLESEPDALEVRLAQVSGKFAKVVGVSGKDIQHATAKARQSMTDLAQAMEIRVAPGSPAARLLKPSESLTERVAAPVRESDTNLGGLELLATPTDTQAVAAVSMAHDASVAQTLTAGIQDITNAMVEDFKLSDVLRMILETMYRAMQFDHVIFCMRDPKSDTMTGRFGLGDGVEPCVKAFRIVLQGSKPDLFSVVCNKGADTMISDAREPRIVQRLPQWFTQSVNAPTFLLLPLQIKGAPFGLIYADKKRLGTLELDEKELSLLRTLRNQAVMAFKQSA